MALKWLTLAYIAERIGSDLGAGLTDDGADPSVIQDALMGTMATAAEAEVSAHLCVRYPSQVAAGTSSALVQDLCYACLVKRAFSRRLRNAPGVDVEGSNELLRSIRAGDAAVPEWETSGASPGIVQEGKTQFQAAGDIYDAVMDIVFVPNEHDGDKV